MTETRRATTALKRQDQAGPEDKKGDEAAAQAHTELREAGTRPRPRSRIVPPELRDDDDDMFNDMPV